MSSLAQEESRSISENVTWGQRKRMADGKVSFAYSRFLGLDKDKETGKIVVNPEQAETVRLIFHLFLEGMTPHSIAAELTSRGIKTPAGKDVWNQQTVRRMLSNEKYKGDALLQKEFTVDFLQKKMKKNEDEVKAAFVSAYNQLVTERKEIIANAEIIRKTLCVTDALQEKKTAGGRDVGACGNDAEHRGGERQRCAGPGRISKTLRQPGRAVRYGKGSVR